VGSSQPCETGFFHTSPLTIRFILTTSFKYTDTSRESLQIQLERVETRVASERNKDCRPGSSINSWYGCRSVKGRGQRLVTSFLIWVCGAVTLDFTSLAGTFLRSYKSLRKSANRYPPQPLPHSSSSPNTFFDIDMSSPDPFAIEDLLVGSPRRSPAPGPDDFPPAQPNGNIRDSIAEAVDFIESVSELAVSLPPASDLLLL
jgi:hypothetical protein